MRRASGRGPSCGARCRRCAWHGGRLQDLQLNLPVISASRIKQKIREYADLYGREVRLGHLQAPAGWPLKRMLETRRDHTSKSRHGGHRRREKRRDERAAKPRDSARAEAGRVEAAPQAEHGALDGGAAKAPAAQSPRVQQQEEESPAASVGMRFIVSPREEDGFSAPPQLLSDM